MQHRDTKSVPRAARPRRPGVRPGAVLVALPAGAHTGASATRSMSTTPTRKAYK